MFNIIRQILRLLYQHNKIIKKQFTLTIIIMKIYISDYKDLAIIT